MCQVPPAGIDHGSEPELLAGKLHFMGMIDRDFPKKMPGVGDRLGTHVANAVQQIQEVARGTQMK